MTTPVDLNEVRNRTLASQARGEDFPNAPNESVYTDSEGNISLKPTDGEGRPLSKVPMKVFAG